MPLSQSKDSIAGNLFTNSCASLVGTATGTTVQKELDGIYKIVSVQDYMTDGYSKNTTVYRYKVWT